MDLRGLVLGLSLVVSLASTQTIMLAEYSEDVGKASVWYSYSDAEDIPADLTTVALPVSVNGGAATDAPIDAAASTCDGSSLLCRFVLDSPDSWRTSSVTIDGVLYVPMGTAVTGATGIAGTFQRGWDGDDLGEEEVATVVEAFGSPDIVGVRVNTNAGAAGATYDLGDVSGSSAGSRTFESDVVRVDINQAIGEGGPTCGLVFYESNGIVSRFGCLEPAAVQRWLASDNWFAFGSLSAFWDVTDLYVQVWSYGYYEPEVVAWQPADDHINVLMRVFYATNGGSYTVQQRDDRSEDWADLTWGEPTKTNDSTAYAAGDHELTVGPFMVGCAPVFISLNYPPSDSDRHMVQSGLARKGAAMGTSGFAWTRGYRDSGSDAWGTSTGTPEDTNYWYSAPRSADESVCIDDWPSTIVVNTRDSGPGATDDRIITGILINGRWLGSVTEATGESGELNDKVYSVDIYQRNFFQPNGTEVDGNPGPVGDGNIVGIAFNQINGDRLSFGVTETSGGFNSRTTLMGEGETALLNYMFAEYDNELLTYIGAQFLRPAPPAIIRARWVADADSDQWTAAALGPEDDADMLELTWYNPTDNDRVLASVTGKFLREGETQYLQALVPGAAGQSSAAKLYNLVAGNQYVTELMSLKHGDFHQYSFWSAEGCTDTTPNGVQVECAKDGAYFAHVIEYEALPQPLIEAATTGPVEFGGSYTVTSSGNTQDHFSADEFFRYIASAEAAAPEPPAASPFAGYPIEIILNWQTADPADPCLAGFGVATLDSEGDLVQSWLIGSDQSANAGWQTAVINVVQGDQMRHLVRMSGANQGSCLSALNFHFEDGTNSGCTGPDSAQGCTMTEQSANAVGADFFIYDYSIGVCDSDSGFEGYICALSAHYARVLDTETLPQPLVEVATTGPVPFGGSNIPAALRGPAFAGYATMFILNWQTADPADLCLAGFGVVTRDSNGDLSQSWVIGSDQSGNADFQTAEIDLVNGGTRRHVVRMSGANQGTCLSALNFHFEDGTNSGCTGPDSAQGCTMTEQSADEVGADFFIYDYSIGVCDAASGFEGYICALSAHYARVLSYAALPIPLIEVASTGPVQFGGSYTVTHSRTIQDHFPSDEYSRYIAITEVNEPDYPRGPAFAGYPTAFILNWQTADPADPCLAGFGVVTLDRNGVSSQKWIIGSDQNGNADFQTAEIDLVNGGTRRHVVRMSGANQGSCLSALNFHFEDGTNFGCTGPDSAQGCTMTEQSADAVGADFYIYDYSIGVCDGNSDFEGYICALSAHYARVDFPELISHERSNDNCKLTREINWTYIRHSAYYFEYAINSAPDTCDTTQQILNAGDGETTASPFQSSWFDHEVVYGQLVTRVRDDPADKLWPASPSPLQISRLNGYQVHSFCYYDAEGIVSSSYSTKEEDPYKISGANEFNFRMTLYTDASFSERYLSPTPTLVLNEPVYVEVSFADGEALDNTNVVARSCWATRDGNLNSLNWALETGTCPADDTFVRLETMRDEKDRFTFDAFAWYEDDAVVADLIYLHCEVRVCPNDVDTDYCDLEDTCPPDDGSGVDLGGNRQRRDVGGASLRSPQSKIVSASDPIIVVSKRHAEFLKIQRDPLVADNPRVSGFAGIFSMMVTGLAFVVLVAAFRLYSARRALLRQLNHAAPDTHAHC